MGKLYLECYAGISGDMMAAALLDLGADQKKLEKVLESLNAGKFETKISRVKKAGLDVCDFDVILEEDNHDHDMAYLHGESGVHQHNGEHSHEHHHGHSHGEGHSHSHGHSGGEGHSHPHGHSHEHRGLESILDIIHKSAMSERAQKIAENIFMILARAEAKAHGVSMEQVHFHEVGALDSIVDIVSIAVCLDDLGIEEAVIPVLYEGRGTVRCQHGILPVPVPAVSNIVNDENLTLHIMDTQGEFVTPTGAAVAAAIRTSEKLPEKFRVLKTGIGAGKRNYEKPSLLRAMLIEEVCEVPKGEIIKLESNIDDCTGEALGFVMERLMKAGAGDVHYFPVYMKKNRPAYQLTVICDESHVEQMQKIIFEETTTIGIRMQRMETCALERYKDTRDTSFGKVEVKICRLPSGERIYPEYESIADICRRTGESWQDVYRQVVKECVG